MTYRIRGLDPAAFADRAALPHIRRVVADRSPGYPCRITLEDAAPGETLLLVHHVSHDVATPSRSAYAIYVREGVTVAADYRDAVPPILANRTLGLRGFDAAGMLRDAAMAMPGDADAAIRTLLDDEGIRYVDVHNAAAGCFLAHVERTDDD